MSVSEIAKRTGVSHVTVRKRISMMESNGEISGYTVLLRLQEDPRIRAWMSIAVEGNKALAIIQTLRAWPSRYYCRSQDTDSAEKPERTRST